MIMTTHELNEKKFELATKIAAARCPMLRTRLFAEYDKLKLTPTIPTRSFF